MGLNIEAYEYREPPITTVRKFVTRVWEHPLVTHQTLDHRANFKPQIYGLMDRFGISADRYIAMAGGSLTWVTSPTSDFDALVITKDQQTADQIAAIPGKATGEVDFVASDSVTRLPYINENWPYNIFFVPDEYIAGDLGFAHALRKHLTSRYDYNTRHKFEYYAPHLFLRFYKEWHISQWYNNANPLTVKKRLKRFNAALDIRAHETSVPDVWKQAFMENLDRLQPPDFDMYAKAMKDSNGALILLENAKAQPITSVEEIAA